MALRITFMTMAVLVGIAFFISNDTDANVKGQVAAFDKVWKNKKSTNLVKRDAIDALPTGDTGLRKTYIKVLESDVWQYRWQITYRIFQETDEDFLASLWSFVTDGKAVKKTPAAGEHMLWALLRNEKFATLERWHELNDLIHDKNQPEKVKVRALREMGVPRRSPVGAPTFSQDLAKQNVRLLIDLLEESLANKKASALQRFVIIDSLENLTSEEHDDNVKGWNVWYKEEREDGKLKFRTREKFKDSFEDADLEGHSFVRKKARATELELLVLPDLGKSDEYWYPYIFELNKTFKCSFIQLPDCSRMKNLKYMKDRTGQVNRTAFDYPLEQLVDVFEKRREKFAQKKVGLIAHGVSGWVALEYLRLHPDKIAFAIIMNTWSGKKSREAGRNQMAGFKGKDEAYKWHAEDLIYDPSGRVGSLSLNDEQKMWSATGSIRRQGGDLKALEPIFYGVMKQYRVQAESSQRILVPDYEFATKNKRNKINTPVLFIHGAMDPMFIEKDLKDYKNTFTKMQWEVFENAGATPWADDPQKFFESIQTMMDKHKIVENLAKEAEKERKKREKEDKKNK
ncbi:MAG: alpha/beta fold hydrolase [Planctomycetota bacterium]|jgi:pimeloyl-ACP methyl ester carboxylesterase